MIPLWLANFEISSFQKPTKFLSQIKKVSPNPREWDQTANFAKKKPPQVQLIIIRE